MLQTESPMAFSFLKVIGLFLYPNRSLNCFVSCLRRGSVNQISTKNKAHNKKVIQEYNPTLLEFLKCRFPNDQIIDPILNNGVGRKTEMMINKERLLEYLETHVGDNTTIFELAKNSKAYDGISDDEIKDEIMKINSEIRNIAIENGYRFNSHHHDNEESGMPWVYDFFIEIADVKKDIARINRAFQYKMKLVLIEEEYGIYDEEKDLMIGFRTSIPWQIKKIYDEVSDEIDRLEAGGRIID
ncbi:MAG: hypothetical protein IIY30_10980 [Erysipelotrichaceae bacterium]|nr:hypothetical protein [Erysipelotrichaceae bacterium]